MDRLFSCRNCIHNCSQSLQIGKGIGFCLQHESMIDSPDKTTCKYLKRKDLPHFLVEESIHEHASEFASFSSLVNLIAHTPIPRIPYEEKTAWEKRTFDAVTNTLAQYPKSEKKRIFLQNLSGGVDGRRSVAHTSLMRRYMEKGEGWIQFYRLILSLLQEVDIEPYFDSRDLIDEENSSPEEVRIQALWDVVFSKIATIQEYGWHAGLEELMWATDHLGKGLEELDWHLLKNSLAEKRIQWTKMIITQAKEEKEFFPHAG